MMLIGHGHERHWRRVTLHAIGWYPEARIGPCYRGGLIIQRQMNGWVQRHEYVVASRPSGQFYVEHEWSMK